MGLDRGLKLDHDGGNTKKGKDLKIEKKEERLKVRFSP